jgi:hypothetical protein
MKSAYFFVYIVLIALLNILFYNNFSIALGVVLVELLILFFYFIKQDVYKYFINYLIFTSLSLEQEFLVGTDMFYGFKNFRILGINLALLALIPPVIIILFKRINISDFRKKGNELYKSFIIFLILTVSGFFWGLFTILVDDNDIQSFSNIIMLFVNRFYFFIIVLIVQIILLYLVVKEKEKFKQLGTVLLYILVAASLTLLFSLVFDVKGSYSHIDTLLSPLISWLIPLLTLVPFYKKFRNRYMFFLIGLIGTFLMVIYSPTGKGILLVFLLPFIHLFILVVQKNFKMLFIFLMFYTSLIIILPIILQDYISQSQLTQNKLNDVFGLISFWEPNWINNIPTSPRYRVVEFINIWIEYMRKPYYLLFGKGYIGSFKDYISGFNMGYVSAFSRQEFQYGTFFSPHDAFNTILLSNGLLGLLVFVYYIKLAFKKAKQSFWIIVGVYWLVILYGFSLTLSVFGMCCLMYGLFEISDNEKTKEYTIEK